MGNEGALGVSELADELDDVLAKLVEGVVSLPWGAGGVSVATHVDGDHTVLVTKLT